MSSKKNPFIFLILALNSARSTANLKSLQFVNSQILLVNVVSKWHLPDWAQTEMGMHRLRSRIDSMVELLSTTLQDYKADITERHAESGNATGRGIFTVRSRVKVS